MAIVPTENYGLMTGLANGVNSFLNTYTTMKNIQHQNQMQEMTAGVTHDENGNLSYTPAKQAQIDFATKTAQHGMGLLTPGSEESKGVIGGASVLTGKQMPNNISGTDLEKIAPFYKPNPLASIKQDTLEETKNMNAGKVGAAYEANTILKNSKIKDNAMAQSSAILVNPNKPVLWNDFNASYQDYLAGTAPGGQPTEGKAHREIPTNFELKMNELAQRVGKNNDLRKDPVGKELIGLLSENIRSSRAELAQQMDSEADRVHENNLQSSNPKVIATNKAKLKMYAPNAYAKRYGSDEQGGGLIGQGPAPAPQSGQPAHPQDAAAVEWAKTNPNDPRSASILKANGG